MKKLPFVMLTVALSALTAATAEDKGLLRVPLVGSFGVSDPTAQTAALGNHLNGTLDYSTGRATYTVELCRLEGGDGLSLPVTLSHVTGGLKPEQEEGFAGIGWDLTVGGFISRIVSGRPDEEATYAFRSTPHTSVDSLRQYVDGQKDNGADRYTYRAGASTGEFIIDNTGRVTLIPASDVSIWREGEGFVIVTPDGVRYRYLPGETVRYDHSDLTVRGYLRDRDYGPVTRDWRLHSVTGPHRTDSLVFAYMDLADKTKQHREPVWSASAMCQVNGQSIAPEFSEGDNMSNEIPADINLYRYARRAVASAGRYALKSVATMSGAVTELEYEPNVIKDAWRGVANATDLIVGLRISRETFTDKVTGVMRERTFEYSNPVPSVDFAGDFDRTLASFTSEGGVNKTINLFGDVYVETSSTGVTMLASSRIPGASPENCTVYYGRVVEKTGGTGLTGSVVTAYTFDLSGATDSLVSHSVGIKAGNRRFCGTYTSELTPNTII